MVQEIRRLVTAGDRSAVGDYITRIAPDELAEATRWFAKGGRFLLRDDADGRIHDLARRKVDLRSRVTVRDVVTVTVSSPNNAAKFLLWRNLGWSRSAEVLMLVDVLASRGEDWCHSFVAAAITRNARADRDTAAAVIRNCLPLILHFKIPTADFDAYPRLWAFYYRELMRGWIHASWDDDTAAKFEYPSWGGQQFRLGSSGRCVILPRTQKLLVELLDLDRTAPDALMRCFGIPDALAALKDAGVGAAVDEHIRRGTVSRAYILELTASALSRCDGSPNQRVLAEVLAALKLDPEEAGQIIPLLISTVATAPGFLSFMALELLLAATLTSGDLQDLSVAVFGRSEKKQQNRLVRHLKSLRAGAGYEHGVLAACWEAAGESSDLAVRTVAQSMLGVSSSPVPEAYTSAVSLWGGGNQESPDVPPYVALETDHEKPLPRWSLSDGHTVVEEQYIDRFLRSVYHVSHNVREWYARRYLREREFQGPLPQAEHWAYPNPGTVLTMWALGEHDLSAHQLLTAKVQASMDEPLNGQDPFGHLDALAAIRTFRHSELALQAGLVPYSLATPGHSDFRVELDRLVAMLHLYVSEGWQYGEADFFQALLRLGPLDSRLARDLPELPVRPLDGSNDPQRLAGRILRDWVQGGSFRPPSIYEALVLPVDLERFPSIPRQLLSQDMWTGGKAWWMNSWLAGATVVPFWPDLGAVWSQRPHVYGDLIRRTDGHLAGATAGGIGLLTQEWLISKLAAESPEEREKAVETMLELGRRRLLKAHHLSIAAQNRLTAGDLPLGRLTRSLALVAYEGHLDSVWPAMTALLGGAAAQQRLPTGTAELLATCTELWAGIPAVQRTPANIPAEFTAAVLKLATTKTATKTSLEAKRLAGQMGLQV
jgi:hypothetical protein